jgi:hypothetical protein
VKPLLAALALAAAVAVAWPASGGAADECRGIQACIPVTGPWVLVTRAAPADYLLTCPGTSVIAGLDALASSSAVHVDFAAQVGAPVSPGVTTSRNALFRATVVGRARRATFQPFLGCVPATGGGGRATVSARAGKPVKPGAPLEHFARNVVIRPGTIVTASVACPQGETRTGAWTTVFFKTTKPPSLAQADLVQMARIVSGDRASVTASASDGLSLDVHAAVQVGVECAP